MRIGTHGRGTTFDEIAANAAAARDAGYTSVWFSDGIGMEPLSLIGALGRAVPDIEFGTAVVRTLPRHPMALAQQALTVQALTGGRLALGIGPSHREPVESAWGLDFDPPVARLRDYLDVLVPLLRDQQVDVDTRHYVAHGQFHVDGASPCPVLVAALGPQMLALAGRRADGTVTTMAGPRTLTGRIAPEIRRAAEEAGRPEPRIVATLSVCVTGDPAAARERSLRGVASLAALPSYAALVAEEGGPPLVAGSEDELDEAVAGLAAAGVTDLLPISVARRESDDQARTEAWLGRLLAG